MRLLLTGATGFLGSHMVRALLARGHELIILKRSSSDTWRINDSLHKVVTYDTDQTDLTRPFQEHGPIHAVVHTATCYGRNSEKPSEILSANTVFPLSLLETAASFGTTTYFNTDTFFNRESSRYGYLNDYVRSKKYFLELARQFAGQNKVRLFNIKLEHVYGALDDDAKFVSQIIKGCLNNLPDLRLTSGEQVRDFIHVDDVISAYSLLLEKANELGHMNENYELGTGKPTPVSDFVKEIHRITGSRTRLLFGELPYRDHEIMHSVANIEALKALGWSPRYTVEQGLRLTISSYAQSHTSVTEH